MTRTQLKTSRNSIRLLLVELAVAINDGAAETVEEIATAIEAEAGTIIANMQIEGITK